MERVLLGRYRGGERIPDGASNLSVVQKTCHGWLPCFSAPYPARRFLAAAPHPTVVVAPCLDGPLPRACGTGSVRAPEDAIARACPAGGLSSRPAGTDGSCAPLHRSGARGSACASPRQPIGNRC